MIRVAVIHRNGEQLTSRVDNRVRANNDAGVAWRDVPLSPSSTGPIDSR